MFVIYYKRGIKFLHQSVEVLYEEYGIPCALITGLGVTGAGKSEPHAWNAAENADSYNIYVDDVLKESGIKATSYNVLNLENGTEYSFAVSAVSTTNTDGAKSEAVRATLYSSYIPAVVP